MPPRSILALAAASLACSGGSPFDLGYVPPPPPPPPPPATCPAPLALADVSHPTTVVGGGTPESCTEARFGEAVAAGGVITFDCGAAPVVITLTSEKKLRNDVDTLIDGGGLVTLDGAGRTRLLHIDHFFDHPEPTLRLQRIALRSGRVSGANPDGGGAAVYHLGGTVEAVQVTFQNNVAAASGPDVAGGAIFGVGVGETVAVDSVFSGNKASSGGAVGALHNGITLINVLLDGNEATGWDGSQGGNGGAVSMDGENKTLLICGSILTANSAGYLGSAIFRTAYHQEPTTIDRTLIQNNSAPRATVYLMGTSLTMTASTVAGNTGSSGWGGLYLSKHWLDGADVPGPAVLTNVTLADNDAGSSLGGALWVDSDQAPVTLTHVTIAGNRALFDAGVGGPGAVNVTYRDTILSGNLAENAWNPVSCSDPGSGGVLMQWPATWGNGTTPDGACAPGALFQDPHLLPLADNGGPTPTMALAAGSPAAGRGQTCTGNSFAQDQRGKDRPASGCALGAYEP